MLDLYSYLVGWTYLYLSTLSSLLLGSECMYVLYGLVEVLPLYQISIGSTVASSSIDNQTVSQSEHSTDYKVSLDQVDRLA